MFKRFKDANNDTYYKTIDEKYLIIKLRSNKYWSVLRYNGNNSSPGYIWNGYTDDWDGFDRLKDAKEHIMEKY